MENKERYYLIIDEVYGKYADSHWSPPENPNGPLLLDQLWSLKPMEHSKESFIQSCKTDEEFSERWGLKIEERKLSQSELNILYNKRRGVGEVDTKYTVGTIIGKDPLVPRKLITVTYNNETIEVYE